MGRPRKENQFTLNLKDEHGDYGIGICNNTNAKFYFDMDTYETIKDYCWSEHVCSSNGYRELRAYEHLSKKVIKMTELLGFKNYDHIDHNTLNNRKYNLRPASCLENNRNASKRKDNTSGIIGVNWNNKDCLWIARISIDGKRKLLGKYVKKTDAIIARLKAEKEYYKEFAPQQHLFEEYEIV